MLDRIYESRQNLFLFSVLVLIISFALTALAVVGTITTAIHYLIFLPEGFLFFISALFGFLILADESASAQKCKSFFSIEAATALFAVLLLPLCWWFAFQQ